MGWNDSTTVRKKGNTLIRMIQKLAWLGLALGLVPLAWGIGPASKKTIEPASTNSVDQHAAALLRGWLSQTEEPAAGPAAGAALPAPADSLDGWRQYIQSLREPSPEEREKKLRALYSENKSPLLRGVILRAIMEEPAFRSNQALFIRRYGFYANWFNRVMYSVAQVVQGNIQVVFQLFVDGVNDLIPSPEADPLTRRAYDMMRRAEAADGRGGDPEKLNKLEKAVSRALAESDMENARWAMHVDDPEAAAFYARQAGETVPGFKAADEMATKADAEAARHRREALASSQVGYPDRKPSFDPASPELLRAILAGKDLKAYRPKPDETLVVEVLKTLPKPAEGRATMMRRWIPFLRERSEAPPYHRLWLTAFVSSPAQNLDERLIRALSQRRGQIWKFIFLGPEKPRQRVYKAASWVSQSLEAMQNIGIFYVFELVSRTGQAVWAPPVPKEEVLDAQAAWLKATPDARGKESQELGKDLAKSYVNEKRFEDARRTLTTVGSLDGARAKKIDRAEARWLLQMARTQPEGPERKATLDRIHKLAPETSTDKAANKLAHPKPRKIPPQILALEWKTVVQWTGMPMPYGIPGKKEWFDGKLENGEITSRGPQFERKDEKSPVTVRYSVAFPDGDKSFEATLTLDKLPPRIRHWFELASSQSKEAAEIIRQLSRLPVPFAVEGGAGPSGVDLYPELLPMQSKPGEIDLYK